MTTEHHFHQPGASPVPLFWSGLEIVIDDDFRIEELHGPLADAGPLAPRRGRETAPEAISEPLPELPPGPWRSLGHCLDYTNWPDRERFVELDSAILASRVCELHAI